MRSPAALLVTAALALAACGGEGGEEAPAPVPATTASGPDGGHVEAGEGEPPPLSGVRGEPATVAEEALTATDPGVACAGLVTPRYLVEAYGDRAGCTAAVAGGAQAGDLDVRAVHASAAEAAVEAKAAGGAFDGQKLTIRLVAAGGGWRVDRVRADVPVGP